jgi:hypothetical protein
METNHEALDGFGLHAKGSGASGPASVGADTVLGNGVRNKDLTIDMAWGKIARAVLSFGGLPGLGDRLFAVPWSAIVRDTIDKRNVLGDGLKDASGFDKDHRPSMVDTTRARGGEMSYGTPCGRSGSVPAFR